LPRDIFRRAREFSCAWRDVTAERIRARFAERGFIAGDDLATALELTTALEKPLLIEGPAGVGKTESAKVLADVLETRLVRLQCYEGLDAASALYEWNYAKQLLRIGLTENSGESAEAREARPSGDADRVAVGLYGKHRARFDRALAVEHDDAQPQLDESQPTCVPVSPHASRRKYASSVRGSTSRGYSTRESSV
jgi:hypothetical protein